MGCGDSCPIYPGKWYEDWELEEPAGKGGATGRRCRPRVSAPTGSRELTRTVDDDDAS
jgi:hypothetical protein